jgi:DNA polymerase elongation subunit (family B)
VNLKWGSGRTLRTLAFDLETLAAGFADPDWVPQKITCAAWSWVDEKRVHSVITDKDGFFSARLRAERLRPFLDVLATADVVMGHNLLRFDLPVLNAEMLRCGVNPLKPIRVQDTIRLPKTKGLKKGQDNLSTVLGTTAQKQAMTWAEWDMAYEEDGWREIRSRAESDVVQNKEMWQRMKDEGWSKPAVWWKP